MWEKIRSFFSRIPRKLLVIAVGLGLAALKAKHPDWPLPDADLVVDMVYAYLAAHTGTDIILTTVTVVTEYLKSRKLIPDR